MNINEGRYYTWKIAFCAICTREIKNEHKNLATEQKEKDKIKYLNCNTSLSWTIHQNRKSREAYNHTRLEVGQAAIVSSHDAL